MLRENARVCHGDASFRSLSARAGEGTSSRRSAKVRARSSCARTGSSRIRSCEEEGAQSRGTALGSLGIDKRQYNGEWEFEWDRAKEAANVAKHGISFVAAARVLESGTTFEFQSDRGGEPRWVAIGIHPTTEKIVAVVYTMREGRYGLSRRGGHGPMKKKSTERTSRGGRRKQSTEKLVRMTSAELAGMADTSDWERVEELTDADIERAIADDPDAAPVLDEAFWRNAEVLDPRHEKSTITMRVDDDVLDFFKRGGSGYQSRMNAVLRAYVYARRAKAK